MRRLGLPHKKRSCLIHVHVLLWEALRQQCASKVGPECSRCPAAHCGSVVALC